MGKAPYQCDCCIRKFTNIKKLTYYEVARWVNYILAVQDQRVYTTILFFIFCLNIHFRKIIAFYEINTTKQITLSL